MGDLIVTAGSAMLSNVFQMVLGCIMAISIYYFAARKGKKAGDHSYPEIVWMILFSFCGMLLPMGTYGVIPIVAALLAVGFRFYLVLPLVFSNTLFNMLVPYSDPSFVWVTGFRRIILALLAGIMAGIILKALRVKGENLIRERNLPLLGERPVNLAGAAYIFRESINIMGIYLVLGVIIDTLFHKIVLWKILDLFYLNSYTLAIPRFFAGFDVVNPTFLLTFNIAYMLMDLTKMSALVALMKPKGFTIYVGYYFVWALLLAIPTFIKSII